MDYVVYQHRNVVANEVFYIGSGTLERAYQFGEYQRSKLWHKYIENNKLKYTVELTRHDKVWTHIDKKKFSIEILEHYPDFEAAHIAELELINKVYGTSGYKLVNSQLQDKMTVESLASRSMIISNVRSKPVINLITNIEYKSGTYAAKCLGIKRELISHQANSNHDNLLNNMPLISTNNGSFIYAKDKILLKS